MKAFGRISLSIMIGASLFAAGAYVNSVYTKWFYPNRYYEAPERAGTDSLKDTGDSGGLRAEGYGAGGSSDAQGLQQYGADGSIADGHEGQESPATGNYGAQAGTAGDSSSMKDGRAQGSGFAGGSGSVVSAMPTLSGDQECTNCDTRFVVMKYDMEQKTTIQEETEIPAKYMGMTKEELQEAISLYVAAPPLAELNQGFVTAEIVSFSPQRVVVRKAYRQPEAEEPGFVIIAEQNLITVYKQDMNTVYLYTDIRLDELPDEVQQEIIRRKYVDTEEELYNFLESYSS